MSNSQGLGYGNLGCLSIGEALITRRRRRGWTQTESAKYFGVTAVTYGKWERDISYHGATQHAVGWAWTDLIRSGGGLHPHERCLLYRRRAELSQDDVAKIINRSRHWVNLMETGVKNCTTLMRYWES